MTREEAIDCINAIHVQMFNSGNSKWTEACDMAIEALREMSVEEYRQRLMEVFHNTDHDELLTFVVMPKEEEFKSLEYILRQYKYEHRPHGEWIPCSDRLPEKDDTGYVLVTVSVPERPFDIILCPTNSVRQMFKQGHISAWMPLPEPYKGEGDEK